jgi:CHAT domain-containing protein
VSDEATAELMSGLFTITDDNPQLTHGEAMQKAMLKLLQGATTNTNAHPYFWAPFIVVGGGLPR